MRGKAGSAGRPVPPGHPTAGFREWLEARGSVATTGMVLHRHQAVDCFHLPPAQGGAGGLPLGLGLLKN